jgi:hypothetical protein
VIAIKLSPRHGGARASRHSRELSRKPTRLANRYTRAVIYPDHVELTFGESDTGSNTDTEVEDWINKHAH